ncbi:MAG: EamA family transporter, partial [Candidatus Baltobacteraceae bacterium]
MQRRAFVPLLLALAAVYVFWGATAPAMRVAVATLPPFAMAAIRFAVAGGILWTWVRLRGVPLPSAREWRAAAITGVILLVAANAVFAWCLQTIPSGIGSLFFSLAPLWMAIFAAVLFGERLTLPAALGLALGFGGMAYLIAPHGAVHFPFLPT